MARIHLEFDFNERRSVRERGSVNRGASFGEKAVLASLFHVLAVGKLFTRVDGIIGKVLNFTKLVFGFRLQWIFSPSFSFYLLFVTPE